ncbi:NmrA family NAD(P)-binding protein [Secundilactobacillus kimchicus]|uniref:NmrA family NAD(P)-binding protein n=1 Tax=Secundilactobacillus kimchicus TaxID=528209 RepID=UPI0024A8D582|nr:NmrA family NAD(P)-binding protein [Secundilactobacillus kimchicus]
MGKVLVTGAMGNVGRYVAQYLISNGQSVVVAGKTLDALKQRYGDTARAVLLDFTNQATFAAALSDVDRVFIMRPPHIGDPKVFEHFIDALKATGNIQLVSFLSLIGIEHNPIPPHYKIEKYIEKFGLPYCHIRPSFFMQNISGVHAFEIKHFDRITIPVKQALTSFIDAEDIGELTASVLSNPSKHQNTAYAITGSQALDYNEVAEILSAELGRKITYANPKPRTAKQYWIEVRGLPKGYCHVMSMLYLMTRMGTAKKVTTTFETVMAKKPQTFRQFVQKNLAAWQDSGDG